MAGRATGCLKWAAIGFAIIIAVAVIAYKMAFPTYSYRYRLHLAVEIEGKVHAGSSVIEVDWSCGLKIADSGCGATLDGQATVIDLGARGVLVALLHDVVEDTTVTFEEIAAAGFAARDMTLEVTGTCADCRKA